MSVTLNAYGNLDALPFGWRYLPKGIDGRNRDVRTAHAAGRAHKVKGQWRGRKWGFSFSWAADAQTSDSLDLLVSAVGFEGNKVSCQKRPLSYQARRHEEREWNRQRELRLDAEYEEIEASGLI